MDQRFSVSRVTVGTPTATQFSPYYRIWDHVSHCWVYKSIARNTSDGRVNAAQEIVNRACSMLNRLHETSLIDAELASLISNTNDAYSHVVTVLLGDNVVTAE